MSRRYPEGISAPLAPVSDSLGARLERALERAPNGLTRAELRKAAGSNAIAAADIEHALASLRTSWKATTYRRRTAGRSAEVWQHTRFAPAHRVGEDAAPAVNPTVPPPVTAAAAPPTAPMSDLEREFADLAAALRRIGSAPTPPTAADADVLEPLIEAARGNRQLYAGCRSFPAAIRRGFDARRDCRRMALDLAAGKLRIFVAEGAQ